MTDIITDRSWVEIDLSAFRHNIRYLKNLMPAGQDFLQIVKADAYGHGAFEIARVAIQEGAVALGVANAEEGRMLRLQGCEAPILILSPSLGDEIPVIIDHGLIPTISTADFAQKLNEASKAANQVIPVHVKVDTGMHRAGVDTEGFNDLWHNLEKLSNLRVEGIFSHFAASESDPNFTAEQQAEFLAMIRKLNIHTRYTHIANSAALINGLSAGTNLCRLGICSYGINTLPSSSKASELIPVMTFKSQLAQLKWVEAGESIGYNRTWKAPKRTRYAIIPVGYADGYDFLLSNRGKVLVGDTLCDVLGRVSMDMICIDVTHVPNAREGMIAVLLGAGNPAIRAENLCSTYQGSAYELLCQVGRRARRYYMEDGAIQHFAPLSRRDFVSSDFTDSKLNSIIESAIAQRLGSEEIAGLISREILRAFFFNKDRDIHYRKNFDHSVTLGDSDVEGFYRATTTLSYTKILDSSYFIVACANSDTALRGYMQRRDVEYRWLMDGNFTLNRQAFELSSVMVNGIVLNTEIHPKDSCLEIRCSHPDLDGLVGKEVNYRIDTITLYPKSSHQLSVFISELTQGVRIKFAFPDGFGPVEAIPVFSGQSKYPRVRSSQNSISITSKAAEWVFPLSGVVFAY